MVNCFAGCDGNAVIDALRERNLWPAAKEKAAKNVQVAEYDYRGIGGDMRFQSVRFENPKKFSLRQPDGHSDWIWNLKGVVLIPYRLDGLADADPTKEVYVVEGEKDVDRLRDLGLVSTCNPMGAGKWRKQYSEFLRDRHVFVLSDNDAPGRAHAEKVAKFTDPVAASLRIVELPGLPEKGGVSDCVGFGLWTPYALYPARCRTQPSH